MKLELGKGLTVNAVELATQVVSALGMRGSGKSNVMTVMVEGLLGAKVQVVVLDYVGIWFGLRLEPDGKKPSPFKIAVLGGQHGDIALSPAGGKVVAEALAATGSPAVLDMSAFTKGDRCRFATDFAEAFFHAKKTSPSPCFLVLEEAQRFVPQKLYTGQERMLGAFEEIAEVGRNYGIGLGLISQRPQKINKDVLNLTELLFAFQTNGVLERKAIADWVQEKDAGGRSDVHDELPALPRGTALVWSPSWLRIYGKYALHKKTTYDAGATPTHARAAVTMKPLDLESLRTSMANVVELAKESDPRALRAEVDRLRRELARAGRAPAAPAKTIPVPFVPPEVVDAVSNAIGLVDQVVVGVDGIVRALRNLGRVVGRQKRQEELHATKLAPPVPSAAAVRSAGDTKLPRGARAMLAALATSITNGLTRRQLATLSGMKVSGGGFSNYVSMLRGQGYLEDRGELLVITDAGRAAAPENLEDSPQGGAELLEYWKRRLRPTKVGDMLEYIVRNGRTTRADLAHAVGMELAGGGFSNYVSILTTRGLVDKVGPHELAPAELFEEGSV